MLSLNLNLRSVTNARLAPRSTRGTVCRFYSNGLEPARPSLKKVVRLQARDVVAARNNPKQARRPQDQGTLEYAPCTCLQREEAGDVMVARDRFVLLSSKPLGLYRDLAGAGCPWVVLRHFICELFNKRIRAPTSSRWFRRSSGSGTVGLVSCCSFPVQL
jgi:hypothetical protein